MNMEDKFESWLKGVIIQFSSLRSEHQTRVLESLISESGPEQRWHLQNRLPQLLYRDFVTQLPLEIVERILSYLDCKSLLAGSCVSHGWNRRIAESSSVWRRLALDFCGIFSRHKASTDTKGYWKNMTVSGYRFQSMIKDGKCFAHKSENDLLLGVNELTCEEHRKIIALDYDQGYVAIGAMGTPRTLRNTGIHNSKCILIWSITNSEIIQSFSISTSISVVKLFWPKYVVHGTFDGRIELLSLESINADTLRFTEQHTSAILTIDGNLTHNILVSGSSDFRVKVWKLSSGELVNVFSDFSHWIDSVLYVPKERHTLASSLGKDLIITMTRDAIQIFDTDYSSIAPLNPNTRRSVSFREKISIPIYLLSSRNYGEDLRENFFTPGFNLIGGNRIAFIRQLPMFDTHTIGDVDILIIDPETGSLLHSVHINKKVRKLLAVGTRFALILLPYVDVRYMNLAVVDLKTSEIVGGCTVPHSHATTPDFAQITVGPCQWLDGLLCDELLSRSNNNLIVSLAINEGVMHNVYWDRGY